MILKDAVIEGVFQQENKSRFLCSILIDKKIHECYVPSSSKLRGFINLEGKKVLLTKNKGKEIRTEYSLFAVQYYNKYILLNLNIANHLLQEEILKNHLKKSFLPGYFSI